MKHYEYTLNTFADTPKYDSLNNFVTNMLVKMIKEVLNGDNEGVEKRYKYYIMNEL